MKSAEEILHHRTKQIQEECHAYSKGIISKDKSLSYEAVTNAFIFKKLAELTLILEDHGIYA